jgi:hypothetical protein
MGETKMPNKSGYAKKTKKIVLKAAKRAVKKASAKRKPK